MKTPEIKGQRENVEHFPVPKGLLQAAGISSDEAWEEVPEHIAAETHTHGKPSSIPSAVTHALEMGGRRAHKRRRK